MKKILHIVCNDKFSSGYINYMLFNMKEYDHTFILKTGNYKLDLMDKNNEYKVKELKEFKDLMTKPYKKLLFDSDKIIVTGIFGFEKYLPFFPNEILSKMFLHFWGGDFYAYRNTNFLSKKNIHKFLLKLTIDKCAGIINLIDGEYEELSKIFPNNKKHFVGFMPPDPRRIENYEKLVLEEKNINRIIVGNSATVENHHIEVFKMLEHLKNENIEIVSPLSYGNMEYAKIVEYEGKKIFGNKFKAIKNFMGTEEYLNLLASCSVGIFNNDRQQAMGNINRLFKLNKKLYLRKGTSMEKDYKKFGLKFYYTEDLNKITIDELFNKEEVKDNYNKMIERDKYFENGWKIILDE